MIYHGDTAARSKRLHEELTDNLRTSVFPW